MTLTTEQQLIPALESHGYFVMDQFLSSLEVQTLVEHFNELKSLKRFKAAKVGQGPNQMRNEQIRSDLICWLDLQDKSEAVRLVAKKLENLKEVLNREFQLGIWDFEGHFAEYAQGAFYQKHIDVFLADDSRVVSVIVYLNEEWLPGDGGELVLHLHQPLKVSPIAGRIVVFLSQKIEHEVLISYKTRKSFTGWFRRRQK